MADVDRLAEADAQQWEDPVRAPRSEQHPADAVVAVQLTQDELEAVEHAADRAGQSLVAFIRQSALNAASARAVLRTPSQHSV